MGGPPAEDPVTSTAPWEPVMTASLATSSKLTGTLYRMKSSCHSGFLFSGRAVRISTYSFESLEASGSGSLLTSSEFRQTPSVSPSARGLGGGACEPRAWGAGQSGSPDRLWGPRPPRAPSWVPSGSRRGSEGGRRPPVDGKGNHVVCHE